MKKNEFIKEYFCKNWKNLLPYLFVVFLSLIPVFFTWGNLRIGGDVLIPFNHQGLEKFLHQWMNLQNGIYYYINYFPFYFFYQITDFFGLGVYKVSALLFFLLNLVAGFGVLKLSKLFYPKEKWFIYFLPTSFYLLSPALLNGWHYLYIYSFIPWFVYMIFKVVKKNEIRIADVLWLSLIFFFSSLDLPNPKYVFHLFFIALIIFIFAFFLKMIKLDFFIKNIWKFALFFLLSAYLFLPLGFFALNYSPTEYGVNLKDGYKATGEMMDFGSTTMSRMFRLHHDNINLSNENRAIYTSNPIIIISGFIFSLVVVLNLVVGKKKENQSRNFEIIILVLIAFYLFFACGPNPPFGFFYERIVTEISLFGFLRTTAGAVFYLSLFYSILLLAFIRKIKNKRTIVITFLIITIIIIGYPFLKGDFYKNYFSHLNKKMNTEDYGFRIPDEYFEVKKNLDSKKIDAKILHTRSNLSYVQTDWGYFGVIYNFLYKNDQLGNIDIYSDYSKHNVRFLFTDNSIDAKEEIYFNKSNTKPIAKEGILEINEVVSNKFLPHLYVSKKNIFTNGKIEDLPEIISRDGQQLSSAIFIENQNEKKEDVLNKIQNISEADNNQVLEFKKISPTKYRIRIHNARNQFPLIFSESFHNGWHVYLAQVKESKINETTNKKLNNYKVLSGNNNDQVNKEELERFVKEGYVTDLGDGEEKDIKHMKWDIDNQKERLDYVEKYNIDFISKDFQGTIQNDNLSTGMVWESWLKKPIVNEDRHLLVNGYANSWLINPREICEKSGKCMKNKNGNYELELVVEFWPQRLFYIGLIVTSTTLLACLLYLGYDFYRKRRDLI